jgi:ferredoxin-NADP reductase
MVLRLKGLPDELSPRNLIHAFLALMLIPLLSAKVIVARYYKNQITVLKILGSLIAGISFLVVIVNVGAYLLRSATPTRVSGVVSAAVMTAIAGALLALLCIRTGNAIASPPVVVGNEPVSERSPIVLQLARITDQTHDAKTLRFLTRPARPVSFRPGQFLIFKWIIDGQTVPRCYSICSSPAQSAYIEITPKKAANGFVSAFLNDRAKVGLTVEVSEPAGQFCFDEEEHRRIVMIAGGSGITPFISMLRYMDDRCLPTEVTLLYFVRTRRDVIFATALSVFQSRLQQFHRVIVLSEPDPEWDGDSGHLTRELIEKNVENVRSATFFLCGPPGMMKAARDLLQSIEVNPANIRQESFGSTPASSFAGAASVIQMARVEFARSKQIRMAASSATLLETAEACGIPIPYSCRQGQCGTCATRLLSGRVRMDAEDGLTTAQKASGYILPCVSRAKGDVRIDV